MREKNILTERHKHKERVLEPTGAQLRHAFFPNIVVSVFNVMFFTCQQTHARTHARIYAHDSLREDVYGVILERFGDIFWLYLIIFSSQSPSIDSI